MPRSPDTITIPIRLYERMALCYYGDGPRLAEKMDAAPHAPIRPPVVDDVEPGYHTGGSLPESIAHIVPRVRPVGMHVKDEG